MLTQETKRKIDSARSILVGKVPDPKAQVEQITIALIYKFMDDMDKEAIELGGKVRFFTNGFQKYAWTKLLDPKLGGHERLELYGEAVARMSQNPHIPQLFRDIFKDAFLPYRNPETLTLFLKEINGFRYDHSEELGNAFEYLLSILGSQGDAGQFRTPRHIIDFIVDVIEPKKSDTILDPACGTAGFLISAYKNILKKQKEKPLTPDEKKKLMNNLVGYDISPDMVKLSKVNMYLHGFAEPKIFEYDTLSSEEKWDESFDVIMANPPFMSPSGGIRPHKRFSVQANRAEVLFVDYIKEHLRPNGRAGIIVPEGIIFQSSGAYKQLRKMLVEDGLFAVVSLPQGVFNPYSGVKTSILFFDNALSKKTDKILFVRVLNDGFDLGAQRRPIDRNDLVRPDNEVDATKVLKGQRIAIEAATINPWLQENSLFAYEITKEQIAQIGDYNLSAERYRLDNLGEQTNKKWPMVKLGDVVIDMKDGGTPSRKNDEYFGGSINWCVVKDIKPEIWDTKEKLTELGLKNSSAKVWPVGSIIISLGASIGHVGLAKVPTATKQGLSGIIVNDKKILPTFLYLILKSKKEDIESLATGVTIKEVRPSKLKEVLRFPLPPIEVQKEIVEQIEVKQSAIEHAKAVIQSLERERRYFGQVLRGNKDIKWVELADAVGIMNGYAFKSENYVSDGVRVIRITNVQKGIIVDDNPKFYPANTGEPIGKYELHAGDLLISLTGNVGRVGLLPGEMLPAALNQRVACLRPKNEALEPRFLFCYLNRDSFEGDCIKSASGVAQKNLSTVWLGKYKVPLPTLKIQKQMVDETEKEEEIITANRRLIEIMETRIKLVMSSVFGDE